MFLLVPAHSGCPGQNLESCKTVACMCVHARIYVQYMYLDSCYTHASVRLSSNGVFRYIKWQ